MLNKILVATDASGSAHRAVELAADMTAKYGAELTILHVIRDMQLPDELRRMAEVEHIKGERHGVLKLVAQRIIDGSVRIAKDKNVSAIRTEIGDGDPAGTIIDYARQHNIDMIVMGTRGLGDVKSVLLGSVSRKISNLCETNVLIVK